MGKFFPLYIRRSDGVLEVTAKNGKREKNEPTPEQLDPAPDAKGVSDYYRLLSPNDAKHADWRKKLGGMLIRELGGKEHIGADKAYLLYDLPESYRLYEHIKTKAQPKDASGNHGAPKPSKNHAGGNNERQDAYLYGHPLGRKKRYRSPADFFPHLLWLATDAEGDSDNCACKVCSPDELQPEEEKVKVDPVKKEESDSRPASIQVVVEVSRTSTPQTTQVLAPRPSSALAVAGAQTPGSQGRTTPVLPPPRTLDQQIDSQYNRFLYRPGELVWYFRGQAWGLAVIVRRYSIKASDAVPELKGYYVQPLSHPYDNQRQVPILREEHMRPWLAWSAPGFTIKGLNQIPNISYDTTDWKAVLNRQYGDGDPQVDGSILAARAIDSSFSLFGLLRDVEPGSVSKERHWNGIFTGAEKLWNGDPARLKVGSGKDVFVITDIIEKLHATSAALTSAMVQLVGDIYQQFEAPAGSSIPSDNGLPSRMREDVSRRNQVTIATKRIATFWKPVNRQARVGLDAIKGRWYEATLLLPIIHGADDYAQRCARGDLAEASSWMNARGDAQTDPAKKDMPVWKQSRIEAFGRAVPQGLAILDGIDPPPASEMAAIIQKVNETSQQRQQPEVPIDDIMDFGEQTGDSGQPSTFY